jgi:hypothetical protein
LLACVNYSCTMCLDFLLTLNKQNSDILQLISFEMLIMQKNEIAMSDLYIFAIFSKGQLILETISL